MLFYCIIKICVQSEDDQAAAEAEEHKEEPPKEEKEKSADEEDSEPDMWEETFKGHQDTKPHGQSLSVDDAQLHSLKIIRPDLYDSLFLRYFPDPFQRVERNNNEYKRKNRPKSANCLELMSIFEREKIFCLPDFSWLFF